MRVEIKMLAGGLFRMKTFGEDDALNDIRECRANPEFDAVQVIALLADHVCHDFDVAQGSDRYVTTRKKRGQ